MSPAPRLRPPADLTALGLGIAMQETTFASVLLCVPSVSPEAPAVLSSPSGEQDDATWLESLQRDVKRDKPPDDAFYQEKWPGAHRRRNASNSTYRRRLSDRGHELVWFEYWKSIYEGDSDPAKRARHFASGGSLARHGRLPPGKFEVICAKYQVSQKTASHIWSGTFAGKGPQHRDSATARLRKIYGEKGVKGVVGDCTEMSKVLPVGSKVEVFAEEDWWHASVVATEGNTVCVRYDGADSGDDDWLEQNSDRIREAHILKRRL